MTTQYKVKKTMNNNVILVEDLRKRKEAVLVGKGIGFNKKKDSIIDVDEKDIEKIFITYDNKLKKDYFQLIESIDSQIIEICSNLLIKAKEELGELNSRIHVVLTDHISFALERLEMGLDIENPFIEEIKTLYKTEYSLGVYARKIIKESLGIDIGEGEVGFIALHLNAAKQNKEVKEALRETKLIKKLVGIIEENLNYTIEKSINYNRLVDHLKGCIYRVKNEKTVENPLIDVLKTEFSESFAIALEIKKVIDSNLEKEIPIGELGYLTIHINRIRNMNM